MHVISSLTSVIWEFRHLVRLFPDSRKATTSFFAGTTAHRSARGWLDTHHEYKTKTMPVREREGQMRGVQPVSSRQVEKALRGVHRLSSRQAEKQVRGLQALPALQGEIPVRGVHLLPPRQGEKRLRSVQHLPPRQEEKHLRGVQNGTRGTAELEADQARAGQFTSNQTRARDQARTRNQA